MKRLLLIVLLLSGCVTTPGAGCVQLQTASLTIIDGHGNVKFAQTPDTVEYCPPSIEKK